MVAATTQHDAAGERVPGAPDRGYPPGVLWGMVHAPVLRDQSIHLLPSPHMLLACLRLCSVTHDSGIQYS